MDTGSLEKMKKAVGLLEILAQGEQDIVGGKVLSQEDFFAEMDCELESIIYEKFE